MLGPPTVSVPGVVRAWAMLLERFGTRPLDRLLQPAIHYAERGFPITSLLSQAITEFAPGNPDPEWRRVFLPGGRPPAAGDHVRAARSGAHAARPRRRGARPLLPRPRRAHDRRAPGARRLPHARRPRRPRRRVGRADLDHVPRVHGLRDAAADAGRDGPARAEHARGRSRSRSCRCTRSSTCTCCWRS